jgi:hypothetical protein
MNPVQFTLCLTQQALCHEGVRGSGCIDPHFLDLGTSWKWVVSLAVLSPGWLMGQPTGYGGEAILYCTKTPGLRAKHSPLQLICDGGWGLGAAYPKAST